MRLIGLAVVLTLSLVLAPFAAEAQPAAKVARIGWLTNIPASSTQPPEAFRQGLRDLGYVEGRNVVIEYRSYEGKLERLPALAAELVALKVDVIVTVATRHALVAKQATRTIPIVFIGAGDPVASGLVTSLARPGGNVTGLALLFPELVGKGLELLKRAVPAISRVAVLWEPGATAERAEKDNLKAADVAGRALGVRLQLVEARGPADLERAFSDMVRARADALTVHSTPMFASERRRLADLAAKHRLPTMFAFRPVEQPTKFELVINMKTAKALGLEIPQSILVRADEIIQ